MGGYELNGAGGRPAAGWKGMEKSMIGRDEESTYLGRIGRYARGS